MRALLRLLLAASLLGTLPWAAAAEGPSIRLPGASLDQARRLAIESGRRHGWSVTDAGGDLARFEKTTAAPEGSAGAGSVLLVRVYAEFLPHAADTLVRLRAEEVRAADPQGRGSTDVTQRYRSNLMQALRSLRARWEARLDPGDPPVESLAAGPAAEPGLGTWAYYAERYAREQGCRLGEQGAVLLSGGAETELHEVHCRGGQRIRVRCHRGGCRAAH